MQDIPFSIRPQLLECLVVRFFFFFNDTATTEIYTLSLHDALPIFSPCLLRSRRNSGKTSWNWLIPIDRKSTRLNSSHQAISYAVFCLKKKSAQQGERRSMLGGGQAWSRPTANSSH